jgi:hypothetical protein
MDELGRVRRFRELVPAGDPPVRDRALAALLASIDAERPRRRTRLTVALGLAAVAGIAAGTASGLGDRLLDVIAGKPASPPVTARLVDEATAKRIVPLFAGEPTVEADKAHGVLAIETPAGPAALWTVPTGGPVCYFVELVRVSERAGKPFGDSRCTARPSPIVPIVWTRSDVDAGGRTVRLLAGYLAENVGSLWLRSPDGDSTRVQTAERFFLAEIDPGHEAYALVARDAAGAEIGRQPVNDSTARAHDFFGQRLAGPERTVIDTRDSRGRPLRLALQKTKRGGTCVITVAGGARGTTCRERGDPRVSRGISVHPTLSGKMVYLNGSVGPEVATLTLEYQNGESVDLPVTERFVLYDIDPSHFAEGRRPIRLVGRDRTGAEVTREPVGQAVFGPKSAIWLEGDVGP